MTGAVPPKIHGLHHVGVLVRDARAAAERLRPLGLEVFAWEDSARLLRRAAAAGAGLAILPELCTISYDFRSRDQVEPAAEPIDGPSVRLWFAIARETGMSVVAGFPERAGDRLYNSAAVIGPEGVRGVYRKAHLYHFERNVFAAGDSGFLVWDISVGRIGVLICYDLRFAEAVRILLLRGAQSLCVPTTWTDRSKAEPWDSRGWCGANYLAAGVAYANRMWVACADRAGQDESVRALGGSPRRPCVRPQARTSFLLFAT